MADPVGLSAAGLVAKLWGQDIPILTSVIIPKKRSLRHFELSTVNNRVGVGKWEEVGFGGNRRNWGGEVVGKADAETGANQV